MNRLLFCLVVMAVAVYTGSAIKCYICDSKIDARCGENFKMDDDLLKDCSATSTHCGKSNRTIDAGKTHTWRSCATGTDLEIKMEGCVIHKVVDYTAVCNTDGCNGDKL